MVGWIILGVIIGLIVLIMLIPIGADIRYEEGIVRISAKAAGIRLQLIPKPKKSAEKIDRKSKKSRKHRKRKNLRRKSRKRRKDVPFRLIRRRSLNC